MKKIAKDDLNSVWLTIKENYQLFLPIDNEGKISFSPWEAEANVDLNTLKTEVPPKNIIFPQSETYLKFKKDGKQLDLEAAPRLEKEYVLFGIRPCDVFSFSLLDNVFLDEPVDKFYKQHRDKGIIISQACSNPEDTCFCSSFAIEPQVAPEGVDVATWDLGDDLLWEAQSEAGQALTEVLDSILVDATEEDQAALNQLQSEIKSKLEELPLVDVDPDKIEGSLEELFNSDVWDELYQRCLGCGICTYVCPTCHCYDIQDYEGNQSGERFRCWDSCMFSDFTMMAHGNPRTTQKQRMRQRFMHKLVYYPNKNDGAYACVGCGRCIEKCPVNLDIVKVIKRLGGEK